MKIFSVTLLLLSSNAGIVFGSTNFRGSVSDKKEEQRSSSRNLGKKENDGNNGGTETNPSDQPVKPVFEEENEVDPPPSDENDPGVDLRSVVEVSGLSSDDAQELLEQQRKFAKLIDVLQDGDNFSEAEMPDEPDGDYVIKYKNGKVSKSGIKAIKRFKKKNENFKVEIIATKYSREDAQGRGKRLACKLQEKGYSHVAFSFDGDEIEIIAKKSSKDDTEKDKGRIEPTRIAEILDLRIDDTDLEKLALILTEYNEKDPADIFHTYGGRKISGGGSQCTTAFSVIHSSGERGVATAAHCSGMNSYDAVPPQPDYSTTGQDEHMGWFGDVEWHTTPHIELAEYYATPTIRWPVRSIANSISNGQWVCGHSRMQGIRRCDRVLRTSVSVQYWGLPRMYNLVAMRGQMMVPGDSGGPWSWYDRAFGVVSGYMTICESSFLWWTWNCYPRDIWSRTMWLGPALGVQVLTQ